MLFHCNALENPIGIETMGLYTRPNHRQYYCNALENPIGIETGEQMPDLMAEIEHCNALENPIGIETRRHSTLHRRPSDIAMHLKTR